MRLFNWSDRSQIILAILAAECLLVRQAHTGSWCLQVAEAAEKVKTSKNLLLGARVMSNPFLPLKRYQPISEHQKLQSTLPSLDAYPRTE